MLIKVGVIGSGFGLYGLLPAFNSTPSCEVVAICGQKTERLLNYCKSIGLKKIYTNWQKMLKNEELDAIAVAVIPGVQYKIIKFAIDKGLNIFAEKPLAVNFTQAEELLNLARAGKIIHMIDFEFPEINEWKKVKEILVKKTFGDLEQISLNWDFLSHDIKNKIDSWKTNISQGGGALSYYFSHSLNYLEFFAGRIVSLKSLLSYSPESLNGGEVGVDLLLKFDKEVSGRAHLRCNSKGLNKHQLIFYCREATIILENEGKITSNFNINVFKDGKREIVRIDKRKNINTEEDERVEVVKRLTTKFIDAIKQNKQSTPSFEDGTRVQELIEIIRANN